MTAHAKSSRLPSGNFSDLCSDCDTFTTAASQGELDALVCACAGAKPTVQYLARLVCLSCARPIATIVLGDPRQPVLVPPALRCSQCGGQPVLDSIDTHRLEPQLPRQHVRRGRPPRWLVEQRRLERIA